MTLLSRSLRHGSSYAGCFKVVLTGRFFRSIDGGPMKKRLKKSFHVLNPVARHTLLIPILRR